MPTDPDEDKPLFQNKLLVRQVSRLSKNNLIQEVQSPK
jgi:hypothetical protein